MYAELCLRIRIARQVSIDGLVFVPLPHTGAGATSLSLSGVAAVTDNCFFLRKRDFITNLIDGDYFLPGPHRFTTGSRVFPSMTNGGLGGSTLLLNALGWIVPCSDLHRLDISAWADVSPF